MTTHQSWHFESTVLDPGVTQYTLSEDNTPLSFRSWIDGLQQSVAAVNTFVQTLKDSPYQGYFWEVKPVTHGVRRQVKRRMRCRIG